MGLRRVDANETDEQREDREKQDEIREKERQDREDALAEKARNEELRAARAESALEEARRRPVESVAPAGPTEVQWQELEAQNPGRSRQEIQAEANKMAAIADARLRPLSEKAAAAEERAKAAEERAARLEGRRSLDKIEDSFYKKNPALESHRKDVEDFMAEFPDNDRIDAKTYEKRLGLAADYTRGKVRNMRSEPRRGEFSSRQVESDGDDERDERSGRFDPKGTGGNRGAIALMEGVMDSYGQGTKHEDSVEFVKKCEDEEGRGVEISSQEDVEHARRLLTRGSNLGGRRGEK